MFNLFKLRVYFIYKELKMIIAMILINLLLVAIFSGALGGSSGVNIGVIDNENSEFSENLLNSLKTASGFNIKRLEANEGEKQLEERHINALVTIPEDIVESISNSENYKVILTTAIEDEKIMVFKTVLKEQLSLFEAKIRLSEGSAEYIKNNYNKIYDSNKIMDTYDDRWQNAKGYKIVAQTYSESTSAYDDKLHTVMGMTLFMSMYGIFFTIGGILTDRKYHTFERLMISPASKFDYIFSSLLASGILGVINILFVLKLGEVLFDVDYGGNWGVLIILTIGFSFAVTSIGLLVSSMLKTPEQLGAFAPVIITSTSMIGGMMWPLEIVNNPVLLFMAKLTPQMWAVKGMESVVMYNHNIQTIWMPMAILILMGSICLFAGVKKLKV